MADLDALADAFFDAYARAYAPLKTVRAPGLPEALVVGAADHEGWIAWRPLRSPGPEPDYAAIERQAGGALPPSYKAWHRRYLTLDLELGPIRLRGAPPPDPLAPLREEILEAPWSDRLRSLRLIPFGREEVHEAGPLCFDARAPSPSGELPIVTWDHDRWSEGEPGAPGEEEIGPVLFSSFERLLACAIHLLGAPVGDPAARARRILDFPRLDPDGAGSEGGFAYWADYAGTLAPKEDLPEEALAPPPELVRRWAEAREHEGFGAQRRDLQHALLVLDRDPAFALELLRRIDDPSMRARAAATRIRCLRALDRHHALEEELVPLAEEWLGPALPNAANQHLDREEMLALARLGEGDRAAALRERIAAAGEPEIVLPEGDIL
jgi:hypothetical protein